MAEEQIKARFIVTGRLITILAKFHDVNLTLQMPRGELDLQRRHVRTLVSNLEQVIKNGLDEAFIRDQADHLDEELGRLFEKDEEPDGDQ